MIANIYMYQFELVFIRNKSKTPQKLREYTIMAAKNKRSIITISEFIIN